MKSARQVDMENFRAALWVSGCEEAFAEDSWRRIRIANIVFEVVKPCARCSITQVNWRTGEYRADNEPLVTLRQYRHQTIPQNGKSGVMFGQNVIHRGEGIIRVNDEVEIIETV